MFLSFGLWEPDKYGLDAVGGQGSSPLSGTIRNVYPGANSWKPIQSLAAFSSAALPATCVGASAARRSDGTWDIFAGTATNLYRYVAGAWAEVTRTSGGDYSVADGQYWAFKQYGAKLVAVNGNDAPQIIELDTDPTTTLFEDLAGTPPEAKGVAVVSEFLVLGPLADNERKIHWSGINDVEQWTLQTQLSDEQEFPDGGRVTGVIGLEDGAYVLQERRIRQMIFQPGSDYVFNFDSIVEEARGCVGLSAWASSGSRVFFLAEDGFYALSQAAGLQPLGANRVNEWFMDNSDTNRHRESKCVVDPFNTRVIWFFYRNTNSTLFDGGIGYDWSLDRWFPIDDVSAQYWESVAAPATSLEDLDGLYATLEAVPYSLDARVWDGGRPVLAGITSAGRLGFLSGSNLAATLSTVEAHPAPGQRAFADEAYPIGEFEGATSLTLRPGRRERLMDSVTWGSPATLERTGKFHFRVSARLHQYELTIPAGSTWTHVQGMVINPQPDGEA